MSDSPPAYQFSDLEQMWGAIGKTLVAASDLDAVLTSVMRAVNAQLNVETGSVLLRVPGKDELAFAKILHGDEEQFAAVRLRVGQGIAGWVAQTGQSALVADAQTDARFYADVDRTTGFTTRALLAVPLLARGNVIGVIELVSRRANAFTVADQLLLEAIAAPVSIAIQNARLHKELDYRLQELHTVLHKVERAKKEWESTIDAIEEAVLLVDENCRILRVNRVLANWLNTTPAALVGNYCYHVVHGTDTPPERCPHSQVLAELKQIHTAEFEKQIHTTEFDEPHLNRTVRLTVYPLRVSEGFEASTANVLKDVTAERRLQAQLLQSEKLAATGRMAASLAHEINNPLQAIQGCLDLTGANLGNPEKQERYLAMAGNELNRLTTIVKRMLDFYRPAKGERTPCDPREILDDVLALAAKRIAQGRVTLHIDWIDNTPTLQLVSNQFKQVFLNLILNALEAMTQGGELYIRGYLVEQKGRWLAISFGDTGVGISPDELPNIFEPFYTTKADGTGLGLAVCQSIVTNHGGHVTAESAPSVGSTFTVWLPLDSEPG
ncbi:MAG: GAF domain-containing protein [Chloroflexi bacterium]|nr:GAF domain-containing protein [Chloroflexota bacterium]